MSVELNTTPEQFILDFYDSYMKDVVFGSDNIAEDIDRFYTPDLVETIDGEQRSRDEIVQIVPGARESIDVARCEVHQAILQGNTIAARFTTHTTLKTGASMDVESYLFAELSDDRRFRRVQQTNRQLNTQ